MSNSTFKLEDYTEELKYNNSGRKDFQSCPMCGKGNKDGKFVPYRDYPGRGHCHSCGKYSPIGKYECPKCHLPKSFNRYIDLQTGTYIGNEVGKCLYCDYHYPPKQWFEDNMDGASQRQFSTPVNPLTKEGEEKPEPSFIERQILTSTLKGYENNTFVNFLNSLFGEQITGELCERYFIGTSKHMFTNKDFPDYTSETGSVIFWQIDTKGRIRTGKVMLYDPNTGKRLKEPFSHIQWAQRVLRLNNFNMKQCLFGEHLLIDKDKPVAIVESEKTAIICSVYFPKFIWLACGGLDQLSFDKCLVLSGRKVILFPDLNGFDKWTRDSIRLNERIPGVKIKVSDLLNSSATAAERENGLDLADYLIRFDLTEFRNKQYEKVKQVGQVPDDSPAPSPDHWLNSCHLLPGYVDYLSYVESLPFYQNN